MSAPKTATAGALFTLRGSHLRACMKASGQGDVRYYLNGVLVEIQRAHVVYVATNGHWMFVCRHASEPSAEHVGRSFILDESYLHGIAPSSDLHVVEISELRALARVLDVKRRRRALDWLALGMIEGKFPDWRSVIGKALARPSGGTAQIDTRYLHDARDAFALVNGWSRGSSHQPYVRHTGPDEAALLTSLNSDACALVMPKRVSDVAVDLAWCAPPQIEPQAATPSGELAFDDQPPPRAAGGAA